MVGWLKKKFSSPSEAEMSYPRASFKKDASTQTDTVWYTVVLEIIIILSYRCGNQLSMYWEHIPPPPPPPPPTKKVVPTYDTCGTNDFVHCREAVLLQKYVYRSTFGLSFVGRFVFRSALALSEVSLYIHAGYMQPTPYNNFINFRSVVERWLLRH